MPHSSLRFIAHLSLILGLAGCGTASEIQAPQATAAVAPPAGLAPSFPIQVLFVGDSGHHAPSDRLLQVLPYLSERDIYVTYTDELRDLNDQGLAHYDVVALFANYEGDMPAEAERALVRFVEDGGGFVPLHSAAGNFRTSEAFIALVGGAFESHGTGTFRTEDVLPDHPALRGVPAFESWDETYVHNNHNPDKTVLSYRVDGSVREPWTWVRTQGKGRVFYTAWGHDERTWGNAGFQQLLESGIRWAAGDWAVNTEPPAAPFEYVSAALPSLEYNSTRENEHNPREMQLPLSPEASAPLMVVPPAFEVLLFAAEPDIQKPIAMNWDERGRLWILETVDYPNDLYEEEGRGNDRVKILEDTDGDGRADKFTVFAEQLSIPTSFVFADGGIVVTQAPHTIFLKDTDGDDIADVRKTLFSGWGTFDTHAGPNNLKWGFDNWIWGVLGYSGFEGKIGEDSLEFRQGFYRFKPDGSAFDYLRSTNNNTWGFGFSEEGFAFASTANNNPSVYMPIPERYYRAVNGWTPERLGTIAEDRRVFPVTTRTRQGDHKGNYTGAAGHALYTARQYPASYWNRMAFVSEPTVHTLGQFALEAVGADFKALNKYNLVGSRDEWTVPIVAEVGPDGAVWMIDWYNFIPQHNLGPFREHWDAGKNNAYVTPLRDRERGRIYRIRWKDAPAQEAIRLDTATPAQLVATLANDNQLWRMHAQRLLVERGQRDVLPALYALVRTTSVDALGLNVGAIHALWTLHGLGALDGATPEATTVATEALGHPSPGVRRTALMTMPKSDAVGAILPLLQDADFQVRKAALLALAEAPASDAAGQAVLQAMGLPENMADTWLPDALAIAAARHAPGFFVALSANGMPALEGDAGARQAVVLARVAVHHATGDAPAGFAAALMALKRLDPALAAEVVASMTKNIPEGTQPKIQINDRMMEGWPEPVREQLRALGEKISD
ncbi:MAG: PVC-type heme-binding CxxCH protein [Rhodothermales bacterium]|nr:PVC-type heme-binding CxxCH protein [Rhodothermales bacterium]